MTIKFGTDGWRAVLDEEFTKENVKKVSLAIAKYIIENFSINKKILIGYDPRNKADELSFYCAKILCSQGFHVYYSKNIIPTPILAYNTLIKNACAIMFTASHNPPEYLGMKFIPDYAGPATTEITNEIMNNIGFIGFETTKAGKIEYVDFSIDYYKHLKNIIDFDIIKKLKTNIIFDGLYSASIGYFDELLNKYNIPFKSINMHHDTKFGGGMPDPKPKYLNSLIKEVKNLKNSIGLANDGDADRFGVINENGEYVSPNEIIAILLKYLKEKGLEGSVIKTVGSSLLIDLVASKLNIDVIETPVGFKYVGEAMRLNKFIIGGEESGGLSIQGHIPEKDGLVANLLILEVMAKTGKSLIALQDELYNFIQRKFYTDRIDVKLKPDTNITTILDKYKNITSIGSEKITSIDTRDGVKLMLGDSTKILIRPSGTEPLLRIYFETDNLEKLEELKTNISI